MRFWPFGKDKDQARENVDFVSRVVTGAARDGAVVRAKLTVHFQDAIAPAAADEIADDAAGSLRQVFEASESGDGLLGQEAALSKEASTRMKPAPSVRSIDIVALHVVSDRPQTSRPPPPPSVIPPPAVAPPPASVAPIAAPPSFGPPAASSRPPPPVSTPPSSSSAPPPAGAPSGRSITGASRRPSSSQMLAVRDSRLIPYGANAQTAAGAIVPLLRDASTRVTVGLLRACDLVIVRGVVLDATSADDLGDLVPVSTVALGRFAEERREELQRWEEKLGRDVLDALRTEASAIVCFFLHTSLERAGVDRKTATALLEMAARSAFTEEAALAAMPHYFAVSGDPTDALAIKTIDAVGADHDVLGSFTVVLTPVLASLQEDFAFTSDQVKASVTPVG